MVTNQLDCLIGQLRDWGATTQTIDLLVKARDRMLEIERKRKNGRQELVSVREQFRQQSQRLRDAQHQLAAVLERAGALCDAVDKLEAWPPGHEDIACASVRVCATSLRAVMQNVRAT